MLPAISPVPEGGHAPPLVPPELVPHAPVPPAGALAVPAAIAIQ